MIFEQKLYQTVNALFSFFIADANSYDIVFFEETEFELKVGFLEEKLCLRVLVVVSLPRECYMSR